MGVNYSFPYFPYTGGQLGGFRLDYATVIPPGVNAHYVRSTGVSVYDPPELTGRILTTVDAAAAQCVSGRGDVINVLPGHAESYAGAFWPSLVAGTRIVGQGWGNMRPTFSFTNAAANCAISVANIFVDNCKFTTSSTAAQVTTAFTCTAAGVTFVNCEFEIGKSVTDAVAITFSLAAGCKDSAFVGNYVYSTTDAAITTFITTAGAVDRLKIIGNHIMAAPVTAATGVLIDVSNAAIVNNIIVDNLLWNNTASSKFVIKPHANSTGWVHNNMWGSGDGSTAPAVSGWSTYTTAYRFGINNAITANSVSALLSPAVDA